MYYKKPKSVTKEFEKRFGGKWKYNRRIWTWECDDGIRYINKVLTGKDMEGEYTGAWSLCMYYRDNSKTPEWVYL